MTSDEDMDWLLTKGTHHPYIVVLHVNMFVRSNIDRLLESGRVNGVALLPYNETDIPEEFSPDNTCPNDNYGLYHNNSVYKNCNKVKWNAAANRLMFEDLPVPIVLLSNTSNADFIVKCFYKHNAPVNGTEERGYPLCAMKLSAVMDGAKDTETCHRRSNLHLNLNPQGYCDPIDNKNVMAYMDRLNASLPLDNKSVTVLAARLDSFSMFDNIYPGVDSATLSFVTLHAVAEALGKVKEDLREVAASRPLLFALFHGEAFDYVGSSRFVYDLINTKDHAPLTLDSIDTFIEVGQVGLHEVGGDIETLYVHTDPLSRRNVETSNRMDILSDMLHVAGQSSGLHLSNSSTDNPLPPASLQSFLKARPDIAGVLISNHDEAFKNKYYNSMYDRRTQSGMDYPSDPTNDTTMYDHVTSVAAFVERISTTVARVAYQLVTNKTERLDLIKASNLTITRLLYCFTVNSDCELLNITSNFSTAVILRNTRSYLSRYVGVTSKTYPTNHHHNLMAYHLGDVLPVNTTKGDCDKLSETKDGYRYIFIEGPINDTVENSTSRTPLCLSAAVNLTAVLSPAFIVPDYQWSSAMYSTWTESRWQDDAFQVRVFLIPSPSQEITTLLVGLFIFVLSLAGGLFIKRKGLTLVVQPAIVYSADIDD